MVNRDDIEDNNVLSYVYDPKSNKSHEYDKIKQANISKIMENFPVHDKYESYSKKLADADFGPSYDAQAKRIMLKKKKEMEAKLF